MATIVSDRVDGRVCRGIAVENEPAYGRDHFLEIIDVPCPLPSSVLDTLTVPVDTVSVMLF